MTNEEIINRVKQLRKEVEVLTSRLRPAGTGHIITAIGVINGRIDELLELGMYGPASSERVMQDTDTLIKNKEWIFAKDEDGFKEHTEAMEQSRLREIQDKAAGRPNMTQGDREKFDSQPDDSYEHTKEYYDTERNKPFAEGLSDRSQFLRTMKQKHGQAVMTTSEMMQEELEPLPINISK